MRLTTHHDAAPSTGVWPKGHYNPSRAVELDGVVFALGCGTTDDVTIVKDRDDDTHYVVTINRAHGYVVIGALDPTGDPEMDFETDRTFVSETTLHNDQHATEHTLDLQPMTLVRRHLDRY